VTADSRRTEEANKAVVRRLISDIMNPGRMDVIDEIYTSEPAPAGRRFHNITEVYSFTIRDSRIAAAWGLEDTQTRMKQLGITTHGK
jgi:hypothetical protein